jgi:hypothetical protein
MLASILQNQNHTEPQNPLKWPGKQPSESCFWCGNPGHWAKYCTNLHPPTRPCSQCGQWGQWRMHKQNSFFQMHSLKFLIAPFQWTEDPLSMFLLGDWQDPDHKAPATGKFTDSWVPEMVSGKHISFFLDSGASRSVLTKYEGPL